MQAVHYRGGAPAAVGVMTGEVQMAFGTALSAGGGIAGGQVAGDRGHLREAPRRCSRMSRPPANKGWTTSTAPGSGFSRRPVRRIRSSASSTTPSRTPWRSPRCRRPHPGSGNEVLVTSPEEFARFIAEETKLWAGRAQGPVDYAAVTRRRAILRAGFSPPDALAGCGSWRRAPAPSRRRQPLATRTTGCPVPCAPAMT